MPDEAKMQVDLRGDLHPEQWQPTAPYYLCAGYDIRSIIEAFELNYNRGAVIKYALRAGRKPGNSVLLDLYKAREHLNREIACLERSK